MSTASDLIKGSLRLLGVIASGETPSAADTADGLTALNEMIESWSTEGLIVPTVTKEELSWASGNASRTWGSGGNFSTARPLRLLNAAILSGGVEYPLKVLTPQEWADTAQKTLTSTIPTRVYLDPTMTTATVYLWPVPSATVTFVPYSEKPLTAFALSSTTFTFPPGYYRALRYNLAIEIATEYGKAVSAEVAKIAGDSKEIIQRANIKPLYLDASEPSRGASFNIYTGE